MSNLVDEPAQNQALKFQLNKFDKSSVDKILFRKKEIN